jgi:hypothetical protein
MVRPHRTAEEGDQPLTLMQHGADVRLRRIIVGDERLGKV